MNAETLMNAMSYIDSDILFAAENIPKTKISKKQQAVLLAAACFGIIIAAAMIINIIISNNLPKLELTVNSGNGMGFEGAFLKNPDEFEIGNPWEYSFSTRRLPVYENHSHDKKGTPCGLNETELDNAINKAVSSLDTTVISVSKDWANDLYGGYENDFVYCVTAETDIASITVNAAGGLTIIFNNPVACPDGCDNAEYFIDKYKDLISSFISFSKPQISTSTGYNVYGKIHRTHRVFDASGNKKESILNYNLSFAELQIDENGALTSIYICNNQNVISKIADYPIINESKAKEKLISGEYISSVVQYDFPGKKYIAKTDLVYKSGKGETVAPYYRFLVELPEAPKASGNKSYGIYYVPAVKDKYLSKIILIDNEFQ